MRKNEKQNKHAFRNLGLREHILQYCCKRVLRELVFHLKVSEFRASERSEKEENTILYIFWMKFTKFSSFSLRSLELEEHSEQRAEARFLLIFFNVEKIRGATTGSSIF